MAVDAVAGLVRPRAASHPGGMTALADAPDQRSRTAAVRAAIAVTAFDLACRHGLDGFTIDDVSRSADVPRRVFFDHFVSREEAVADVVRVRLGVLLSDAEVVGHVDGLAAMLRTMVAGLLSESSVATFRTLATLVDGHAALAAPISRARAEVTDQVARVVRGLAEADLAVEAPEVFAYAVPGALAATVVAVYTRRLLLREVDGDVAGAVGVDDVVRQLTGVLPGLPGLSGSVAH